MDWLEFLSFLLSPLELGDSEPVIGAWRQLFAAGVGTHQPHRAKVGGALSQGVRFRALCRLFS